MEPLVKALAVRLYHQGLSLRRVCEVLGELGDGWRFSYEALRRLSLKAIRLMPRRRRRGAIALNETVLVDRAVDSGARIKTNLLSSLGEAGEG